MPALFQHITNRAAMVGESLVASDPVLPVTIAAAVIQAIMAKGKFHGRNHGETPIVYTQLIVFPGYWIGVVALASRSASRA